MDQVKIGKFIAELRKSKNMTQEQLGEKLGVSFKTISKWENGRGMPELSTLKPLSEELGVSINEIFAGEKLKESEIEKQSEKNILDILNISNIKDRKNKILLIIILALLAIIIIIFGRYMLIKCGFILDNNLKYSQVYIVDENNNKGNVDINKFGRINIDFDIGANKYGNAVFKNPPKAFKTLKREYAKGIKLIQKEFNLLPLTNFTYKSYKTYGWQVTTGTDEEKEQARFVTSFLDIYENSFNN